MRLAADVGGPVVLSSLVIQLVERESDRIGQAGIIGCAGEHVLVTWVVPSSRWYSARRRRLVLSLIIITLTRPTW